MPSDLQITHEFGQFTLVPSEKQLFSAGKLVPLHPKAFDTLVLLVENHGRLIQKDELLQALWPNSVVEEVGLSHNVSQLRRALGDTADDPKFIETVPKRGYRFIAPVRALHAPASRPDPASASALAPSAAPHAPASPPTILVTCAVFLVLVVAVAGYLYWPRAGERAAQAPAAIHSLAVLPLENLSGDKEQEYFADGITDALTTDLAQLASLRVTSRTSAMQFKGAKQTLPQIARDLQVEAVVEGTVARGQGRVRITAQLIEARGDRHLWARTYERDAKEVLALQDEIAADIADEIRIKLTPKERSLLTQSHAVEPDAYDAYLRGRYWWSQRSADGEWKGLEYFQRAIAKDPSYALAYAGVADSFIVLGHHDRLSPREALPKAKAAALRAIDLDPSLAEAHTSLAIVRFSNDWDWTGAEQEFKQALALNPNYATAHHWYSHYLVAMGRLDEAVSELERARDLDPYSVPINSFLGQALYYARRYDDALRQYRRALEMHPDRAEFYEGIANIYEQKKMFAETVAARLQALELYKDQTATALDEAYRRSGYEGYLRAKIQTLEQTFDQAPQFELFNVLLLAHLYAAINDEAHAMPYLERAFDERNPWLLNVQVDPSMDSLHSSPAFRALIRRIGLPSRASDGH